MTPNARTTCVFLLLLLSASALAQNRGAITVWALVRSSVLFSWTTPAGTTFSQGGEQSASAVLVVLPTAEAQSFSTRAVAANNPSSPGYDLVARVAGQGVAAVDGMELSTKETLIASRAPYAVDQTHSIAMTGPAAVTIILTCRPR